MTTIAAMVHNGHGAMATSKDFMATSTSRTDSRELTVEMCRNIPTAWPSCTIRRTSRLPSLRRQRLAAMANPCDRSPVSSARRRRSTPSSSNVSATADIEAIAH